MDQTKSVGKSNFCSAIILLVGAAAIVYLFREHFDRVLNIAVALIGLGVVILIHEGGHFVAAKLLDIKVEAFSVGMGHVLLGFKKTARGYRIRILPDFFRKQDDPEEDGLFSFFIGSGGEEGDCEYRISLIPVGGFVKPLGQEDVGTAKEDTNPRSFLNKAIWKRIVLASTGVTCNVVLAIIIFMGVFMAGIKFSPAIVGDVIGGMPAAKAGLQGGDEIIEINGKGGDLDFAYVAVAAALSSKNEVVSLKVKRRDGTIEDFELVAENMLGMGMRGFGIIPASSLTIAKVADPNALLARTGLKKDDRIVAVAGEEVDSMWQFEKIVSDISSPSVSVTVERAGSGGSVELLPLTLDLDRSSTGEDAFSVVPRLKIASLEDTETTKDLRVGDIIVDVAGVVNPTILQLRRKSNEHADKEMAMTLLRADDEGVYKKINVKVTPVSSDEKKGEAFVGMSVERSAESLPFKPLVHLYKADGPADAIVIGCEKTVMFVKQVYVTLRALVTRTVSPKNLMGPVGIIAMSSKIIAERAFAEYFYFMGLISACLAVMNFLPLPILDGGLVVMLIIEKIKGSPVNIRVQEVINYAGLAVLATLFIVITYNDIVRVFFG